MSRTLPSVFSALLLGTLAFPAAVRAAGADYTFQTVDVPGANLQIEETLMNDGGLIVQQYQSPVDAVFPAGQHTALLSGGAWTNVDVPKADWTGASSPNAQGQVALTYALADGVWHVAIYDHGNYLDQPDIPHYQRGVNGLNDRGQLTGFAVDAAGVQHGFVETGAAFTVFDYPDSQVLATNGLTVNDQGTVVGDYYLKSQTDHAFVYDSSGFKNIDVPGAQNSTATGINEKNEIAGFYELPGALSQGFLLQDGQYTTVDFPGAKGTHLWSINAAGDLAGDYQDADGAIHGFVAMRTGGG